MEGIELTSQRGLFKGQKGSRKSGSGGEYMGMQDGDSAIMQINLVSCSYC